MANSHFSRQKCWRNRKKKFKHVPLYHRSFASNFIPNFMWFLDMSYVDEGWSAGAIELQFEKSFSNYNYFVSKIDNFE